MVHSATIYGLYYKHFDALLFASIFLPQVIVWIGWIELGCCHRGRQSQLNGEEQGEENVFLQEGLGISEMSVGGVEAPPPSYSNVVSECEVDGWDWDWDWMDLWDKWRIEHLTVICNTTSTIEDECGPPPSYSELDLQKTR